MTKTLLYHDTFLMKGGAERMNIEIAKILSTDIATAKWSHDSYDAIAMGYTGKVIEVDPSWKRGGIGFILMKLRFYFKKNVMTGYDRILFSNEAITALWGVPKGAKTYYYAHSISRHLFDQYEQYLAKVPRILKPIYKMIASLLRKVYIAEMKKVGTIFVNSVKNQERMMEWMHRNDAIILYPPVDMRKFTPTYESALSQTLAIEGFSLSYKDYYISFSRLTHAKRIDVIIEAFAKIPDKKLLVLYGKNDPQKEEFFALGAGHDNIVFRVLADNEHLPDIIGGALASIAVSKEEDFGMVAIESMACGVPVIAVDSGGYRETILPGKTGFLLPETGLRENLVTAILSLRKEDLEHMKDSCRERANEFSLEKFRERLLHYFID